jgi:hypothetical protein
VRRWVGTEIARTRARVPTVARESGDQGTLNLGGSNASSGSSNFDLLRDMLARDAALRSELESALRLNVDRVNPTDPGNRFVVGGAVEWIIAAAAWAAGALSVPGGHSARGFDLMDLQQAARGMWSVKSASSKAKSEWRISNGLGGAGRGFDDPTVFVSPHLPGLVYVDPELHADVTSRARQNKDAVVIGFGVIVEHAAARPECVAPLRAPANEGRGAENPFLASSQTVLTPDRFPRLAQMFAASKPATGSKAEQALQLIAAKNAGDLTDDQFNTLIRTLG